MVCTTSSAMHVLPGITIHVNFSVDVLLAGSPETKHDTGRTCKLNLSNLNIRSLFCCLSTKRRPQGPAYHTGGKCASIPHRYLRDSYNVPHYGTQNPGKENMSRIVNFKIRTKTLVCGLNFLLMSRTSRLL